MKERKKIIAGNWKMYKTAQEAREFILELAPQVAKARLQVFLAVPFTALHAATLASRGTPLVIGAQNMHDAAEGAFTGEVSSRMLLEAGARFVLLGHSERRQYFHESNSFLNRKIKRALLDGLMPMLCVGETQEEREEGRTEQVLSTQLKEGLEGLKKEELSKIVIAYEPVWAIGTGKTATPEMAQAAHKFVRSQVGADLPILYGGSVKPETIAGLMQMPDIDGALVGGASLNATTFAKIITEGVKK